MKSKIHPTNSSMYHNSEVVSAKGPKTGQPGQDSDNEVVRKAVNVAVVRKAENEGVARKFFNNAKPKNIKFSSTLGMAVIVIIVFIALIIRSSQVLEMIDDVGKKELRGIGAIDGSNNIKGSFSDIKSMKVG